MTDHELEVRAANDKLILDFLDSFSYPCTDFVAEELMQRLFEEWPNEQGTTFREALSKVWDYFMKTTAKSYGMIPDVKEVDGE